MKQILIAACSMLMAGVAAGQAGAQENAPRIDDIVWFNIDSYCSFGRVDHTVDYKDPESWRWVLFSNYPGADGGDPLEAPFMRIDGQLTQLGQTGVETIDGGVVRTYSSHDAEPYVVQLKMLDGVVGYESSAFSGTITVSRKGASSEVAYKGDCGV